MENQKIDFNNLFIDTKNATIKIDGKDIVKKNSINEFSLTFKDGVWELDYKIFMFGKTPY